MKTSTSIKTAQVMTESDTAKKEPIVSEEEKKNIPLEHTSTTRFMLPEDAYECIITAIRPDIKRNVLRKVQEKGAYLDFRVFDGPYAGKEFTQFFTNKLTPRSKLTLLVRAIFGRDLQPEEMAKLQVVEDLRRFLLNKPLKVILLIRHSVYTDSIWYDVAFFLKSNFYDEEVNTKILESEEVIRDDNQTG